MFNSIFGQIMKLYEFFSVPSVEDSEKTPDYKNQSERERLANDVYWFILDHDKLHKEHFMPIAQDIRKEHKTKKEVDRKKYTECWAPMVEQGCMEFYHENHLQGDPKKLFDEDFVKSICERLAERHIEDVVKGEYKLGD